MVGFDEPGEDAKEQGLADAAAAEDEREFTGVEAGGGVCEEFALGDGEVKMGELEAESVWV
jgi:hypothetical protein